MANIKVSEMTEATSFDDGDYTMIVQANQNKKISKEDMLKNLISDLQETTSFENNDYAMILQENQNKKISKGNLLKPAEFIVVTITNSQTITQDFKVPFNETTLINGNFSLINSNIIIGENINHVRISFSAIIDNWAGSINYIGAIIKKNNIEVSQAINGSTALYLSSFVPSTIIAVEQNDVISVELYSPSGGNLRSGSSNTWLCVEKID